MENAFTITHSDGKLNEEPNGNFVATSSLPSDFKTIIKGTSDIMFVNYGLPGHTKVDPRMAVKENGSFIRIDNGWGNNSAVMDQTTPIQLHGSTIYGYIMTDETVDGQECIVINFITDPNFKTGVATYKGWGRTDIEITTTNLSQISFTFRPEMGTSLSSFIPMFFMFNPREYSNASRVWYCAVNVERGEFNVRCAFVDSHRTINYQHVNDENYVAKYGPQPITILDTDVIIPSLEDRVSALEEQVAAIPGTIDTAFALAVDKVSKLFITR